MISGRSKKTKRSGADRRWTLLFIGDHGNVIALKRFKAIVMAAAFMFISAICVGVVLFFVNRNTIAENKELQAAVEKSKARIETLGHEKEVLMARLVIAESKARENRAEQRQIQTDINAADPITPKTKAALKEPEEKAEPKTPPAPQPVQPKPVAAETVEPEPVLSVALEDFGIAREPDTGNLSARFKIKNTSSESESVSGHTVVVLKSDDLPPQKWLVLPSVAMVGDMPSGKKGKAFSIRRYRTMNFTFKTPEHFDALDSAVVYVFLNSGELILEEDFPVTLPAPQAPASSERPSQAVSGETAFEQKPSEEALSEQTPPAGTPSSEEAADPMFF